MIVHSPVDINVTKFVFYFCHIICFQFVGEHEVRKGLKADLAVLSSSHILLREEVGPEGPCQGCHVNQHHI